MSFSGRQRLLLETNMARDRAEALLASLLNAQRAVDRETPSTLAGDIVSRDSMDRAISATKEAIARLTAELEQASRDLDDDDLDVLDAILDDELDVALTDDESLHAAADDEPTSPPVTPTPGRPRRQDAPAR